MSVPANEVGRLLNSGQFAAARTLLREICVQSPGNAMAWHNLALALARLGELSEAIMAVERALALPPVGAASMLLAANIYQDAGRLDRALGCAREVPAHDPAYAQARNQAGILLADLGRRGEAEGAFREAIAANPRYARAFGNLAGIYLRSRRLTEALAAANEAIRLQPDYAHAHYTAASAHLLLGGPAQAILALQNAIMLEPAFVDALLMLARIYRQQQAIEPALEAVRRLLQIAPEHIEARAMLGDLLAARGDLAAAKAAYAALLAERPNFLEAALRHALMLPVAYENAGQIDETRHALVQGLETLFARSAEFATLPATELVRQVQYSNFYLAYQGRDDLPIQRRYAELVARLLRPALPDYFRPRVQKRVEARRIKIGFVSRFFYDSTAGNYFASWVTDLDRDAFEVFVFYTHTQNDRLTDRIRARADVFAPFEPDFIALAAQISASDLDVLVYPELGMDARTFTLAAMRLAPVQVCGWGHPVTSGHENVDFFLSCAAMEPPDAQGHYRESLALLPGLGTRYSMPVLPAEFRARTRADYQLPSDKILYLAPQSLFKIHPDNDALLVDILVQDPDGVLVLFAGQAEAARQIFMARLTRAFAARGLATAGRVKILPDVSHADYQRINELCDLMLDSLHWSGGNTSLDALAFGLPVVTLPGPFMRGRQSMAMLQTMGVNELIAKDAADYVGIACRLGRDQAWRGDVSRRILEARHRLFDDPEPTTVFAKFLRRVTNRADDQQQLTGKNS